MSEEPEITTRQRRLLYQVSHPGLSQAAHSDLSLAKKFRAWGITIIAKALTGLVGLLPMDEALAEATALLASDAGSAPPGEPSLGRIDDEAQQGAASGPGATITPAPMPEHGLAGERGVGGK